MTFLVQRSNVLLISNIDPCEHCTCSWNPFLFSSVSVSVTKHWPNQSENKRVNFHLTGYSPSKCKVINLEPGGRIWSPDHRGMLPPHSLFTIFSIFFLIWLRTTQPRSLTSHCGLGPLRSVMNQENTHILTYRPAWWWQLLTEAPSSQMTLVVSTSQTDQHNHQLFSILNGVMFQFH